MFVDITQYQREFVNFPPSTEELDEAIIRYEAAMDDLKDWAGTIQDLWDGQEYLPDWHLEGQDNFLNGLRNQWFWSDKLDYERMFNEIKQCFFYYKETVSDLTEYRKQVYNDCCMTCGQVVAA